MRLSEALPGALAAAVLTAVLAPGSAAAGNLLDLVPSMTPAVMVVKSPAGLGERLRAFAGLPPSVEVPEGENDIPGLGPLPEGIDAEGQAVLAMPQFPFPLVILPVSDFGLFMESLRGTAAPGADAAPPSSPAPGIEAVTWNGKPFFVRRDGDHAMISPMPMLLNTPPPGTGLSAALSADELALLEGSEVFLRLDVGMILTLADPFLQPFLQRLDVQPAVEGSGGEALDPRSKKLLKAEIDLFMKGLRQVRSLTVGGDLGESEASLSTIYLPQPGSGFEKLLAAAVPDRHELLRHFGTDSAMAGGFTFDPDTMGDLIRSISMFVIDSGAYDLAEEERREWETMIGSGLEAAGRRSAWSFGPSPGGAAFSMLVVSEVRDGRKIRTLMKESMSLVEKILLASPEGKAMRVEFREGVESHGGYAIDRLRFVPATGSEEEDRKMQAAMEMVFGASSLDMWFALSEKLMVASYYSSTSAPLKGLIDRLASNQDGGLTSSPAFREATEGLPEESLALSFFSLPRFLSLFSETVRKARPDKPLPDWPLSEEDSSGIGFAYYVSGGALRVDTLVPRREVRNIKVVFEHLQTIEGKEPLQPGIDVQQPVPF